MDVDTWHLAFAIEKLNTIGLHGGIHRVANEVRPTLKPLQLMPGVP